MTAAREGTATGAGQWRTVAALLFLIAAASTSLGGLFDGPAWWFLAQAVAVVAFTVAALSRLAAPAWCASLGAA
ncbi:MAG TPA: hypothetical protein VFQ96_03045, partial [Microbacteriaceae bacterium]|nr:hypothetical protein [Microbacteriaceae bacterium]